MPTTRTYPTPDASNTVKPSGWVLATDGLYYPKCACCGQLLPETERYGGYMWLCYAHRHQDAQ